MRRSETRVARLEARTGTDSCKGPVCGKCALGQLDARLSGRSWGGCDGRPEDLGEIIYRADRELARRAGGRKPVTEDAIAGESTRGRQ